MTRFPVRFLVVALTLCSTIAYAQTVDSCRACLQDKIAGTGEQVVMGAALGAIGGASGLLPGAVCGAILGATGAAITKLIDVAQCQSICEREATERKDPQAGRCTEMVNKASAKR